MLRPVTIATLSAGLAFSGCGGGKDEPDPTTQVKATLTTFVRAIQDHEYDTLCDRVFAPSLLEGLARIGLPCEVAMRNSTGTLRDPKLTVGQVTVSGTTATAEIRTSATGQKPSSNVIELVKIQNAWRVSALSAAPSPSGSATPGASATPRATRTPAPAATAAPTS